MKNRKNGDRTGDVVSAYCIFLDEGMTMLTMTGGWGSTTHGYGGGVATRRRMIMLMLPLLLLQETMQDI